MNRSCSAPRAFAVLLVAAAFALWALPAVAANPANGTTSTGQGMAVEITLAPDPLGTTIVLGDAMDASALATLGATSPQPVNFMGVLDLSGSMSLDTLDLNGNGVAGEPGDNCDAFPDPGNRLDAACFAMLEVNRQFGSAANVDVGMVVFASVARAADVSPVGGLQVFTTPPDADLNGNSVPDMEEVITSVRPGAVLRFTTLNVGTQTVYSEALRVLRDSMTDPTETNVAAFISDGQPSDPGSYPSVLSQVATRGIVVHTFAVGASVTCAPHLQNIADQTGGTCTDVADPTNLPDVVPDVLSTNLASLELVVNGTLANSVAGPDPAALAVPATPIGGLLIEGANTVEATAVAEDGTTVTADVFFDVIRVIPVSIDIKPGSYPNSINLRSRGGIPVAIFGTDTFDVSWIAPETLLLADAPVLARGKRGKLMVGMEDVNGDGYMDLVAHFDTTALNLAADATDATLTGELMDGTPIEGQDSVRIVPPR